MIHQLPAPVRGATHVRIDEVTFTIPTKVLIVRGTFGTLAADGVTFTPDALLAKPQRMFSGADYAGAVAPFGPPMKTQLLPMIDEQGWG